MDSVSKKNYQLILIYVLQHKEGGKNNNFPTDEMEINFMTFIFGTLFNVPIKLKNMHSTFYTMRIESEISCYP